MAESLVCFDLGGVLVRVARIWRDAVQHAGVEIFDQRAAATGLSECPGFDAYQAGGPLEDYLTLLRHYLGLASNEEAMLVHQAILMDPYPGTLELVNELHEKGIATACLSNTNAPHYDLFVDHSVYPAIASLKRHILSHLVGCNKPDEAIYRKVEAVTGFRPNQIVFFDDHPGNVQAANEFGWRAHRIDPTGDTVQQIRDALTSERVL